MPRKKTHRRASFLFISLTFFSIATIIALSAFEDSATLYMSPTELILKPSENKIIRVGGLVKKGSIHKLDNNHTTEFIITDLTTSLTVQYNGILPNLFAEEKGAVAKGYLRNDIFIASELLAKHDENYMPPEVSNTLKKNELKK